MARPRCTPGIYSALALVAIVSLTHARMDITAYEYQRRFGNELKLGECPFRQLSVPRPNKSDHIEEERCTQRKKGVIRSIPRALNDTRNELIKDLKSVMKYLGICRGEAASYLGILHKGECVAVEMASRLTFGDRTVVRAFVGYYRTSLDILDTRKDDIREGMESYYKNKYYVKNRSYGTLEIIVVQFRFRNRSQAAAAKKVTLSDPTMSAYMAQIRTRVGEPKSVLIVSLSTATQENFKLKNEKEWNRALRYVHILELQIKNVREQIARNVIKPHLKYELMPFLQSDLKAEGRMDRDPIVWEETSLLEVRIRRILIYVKKLNRKCRKNKSKVCQRVRELRRNIKAQKDKLHKERSLWVNLTKEDQLSFTKRYSSQIDTFASLARRFSKDVKNMRRQDKRNRLNRKRPKNSSNQIPPSISNKEHRIRHFRKKYGKRKTKAKKPRAGKWAWF